MILFYYFQGPFGSFVSVWEELLRLAVYLPVLHSSIFQPGDQFLSVQSSITEKAVTIYQKSAQAECHNLLQRL